MNVWKRVECTNHENMVEVSGILERAGWTVVEIGSTLTETYRKVAIGGKTTVLWAAREVEASA